MAGGFHNTICSHYRIFEVLGAFAEPLDVLSFTITQDGSPRLLIKFISIVFFVSVEN